MNADPLKESDVYQDQAELNDGPDKELTFIHHDLTPEQHTIEKTLLVSFNKTVIPEGTRIKFGKSKIEPFNIELERDGLKQLGKKRLQPFLLKGENRELLKRSIEALEEDEAGIENPSKGTIHASPCFFTLRRRSDKKRLCVAFNNLNEVTLNQIYSMPNIEEIINRMRGKLYFSIIDLKSAYMQVALSDFARSLSGVLLPWGIFRFNVLNFGYKNAPAFFQQKMTELLKRGIDKNFVSVFIDDIIIASITFEEHCRHLAWVLTQLRSKNLVASRDKAHLFLKQMKLLGKVVNGQGVTTDPAMIIDIVNFPEPTNKHLIRSFIGLVGSYRTFIKDFNLIAEPLIRLTKKNIEWVWSKEQSTAFNTLKEQMARSPILAHLDLNKELRVVSDASKIGAGGALLQLMEDRVWHPVAYASWLFNSAQRNYSTTDRELLSVVLTLRKWRHILMGRKISFLNDHKPLAGYMKSVDPHGRLARWAMEFQAFNIDLQHIKGTDNVIADALSRTTEGDDFADVNMVATITKDIGPTSLVSGLSNCEDEYFEYTIGLAILRSLPGDIEWAEEQRRDRNLLGIIRWLESGTLPDDDDSAKIILYEASNYALAGEEKVLVRITRVSPEHLGPSVRRVVPKTLRRCVLALYHDSTWAGAHRGRDKTYHSIRDKFYFDRMSLYTQLYVKTCRVCQLCKNSPLTNQTKLGNIEATGVWDLVSIDIWGLVRQSANGNRYVLTVVDGYTKWAMAIALAANTSEMIARALRLFVFQTFGIPNRIHSDKGKEFCNNLMDEVCRLYGTKRSSSAPYHPQSNSYAERIHQFYRNAITAFIQGDQLIWDEMLIELVTAYNNTYHAAIGCRPSEAFLGRPIPVMYDVEPLSEKSQLTALQYSEKLKYMMQHTEYLIQEQFKDKLE